MRVVVQKYGGKSVGDIDLICDVAQRIVRRRSRGDNLVVVVSAMADTTDTLLDYARRVSKKPREREVDMLLTAGERISMALLSMAIWERGFGAISFTGSQSGIITDDVHTRARIVEIRAERIIHELQLGRVVIVAGFQGVSARREVTTLGRGGSDTTAVAIACALGAERCEIYSDVAGLFSADPKRIPNARHIPEIDYETLFDIAFFGSKVIHPRAVELARKYKIPLVLASSMDEGGETMVGSRAMEGVSFVAVSATRDVVWVEVDVPADALCELWRGLDRLRTEVRTPALRVAEGGRARAHFWIPPERRDEVAALLARIPGANWETKECSIVAASGYGIAENAEALSEFVAALREAGIPFERIGTTNRSIYALVPRKRCDEAERILHRRLVCR